MRLFLFWWFVCICATCLGAGVVATIVHKLYWNFGVLSFLLALVLYVALR